MKVDMLSTEIALRCTATKATLRLSSEQITGHVWRGESKEGEVIHCLIVPLNLTELGTLEAPDTLTAL